MHGREITLGEVLGAAQLSGGSSRGPAFALPPASQPDVPGEAALPAAAAWLRFSVTLQQGRTRGCARRVRVFLVLLRQNAHRALIGFGCGREEGKCLSM